MPKGVELEAQAFQGPLPGFLPGKMEQLWVCLLKGSIGIVMVQMLSDESFPLQLAQGGRFPLNHVMVSNRTHCCEHRVEHRRPQGQFETADEV